MLVIFVGSLSYTSLVGFSPSLSWAGFILCGEFLWHIPCWLFFFSPFFFFFFLSGEFLLHIPRWLYFSVRSFSYTSHDCFISMWGVSLTHPMLAFFFFFLLLIWWVSLTHPVPASYLCGEFLLQIPYWLYFYLGSFSYTSHACFLFLWGVCLTHP